MRKIAIFVEGQTERIFVEKFLAEYLGYHKIEVESWKDLGIRGRVCKGTRTNPHAEYYFLIYDVGGDAKVNSALKERAGTMINEHGYDYLLGLRDVYDEYSREEIPAAIQGFKNLFQHCSFKQKLRLIFAIMEIEAWFLADYNVFGPEAVYALAQSLIDALGINPNTVLIWDRSDRELRRSKYTLNTTNEGIRCFGNVKKFTMVDWAVHNVPDEGIGYDENAVVEIGNGKQTYLSKILTECCTYLVNVPVLKDHGRAGVTLSLKNHYGSISEPWLGHDNFCDPYVANLNAAPHIKDKTKLIVCDALFGMYRGGPQGAPQWINRQLLASNDPVALDYAGLNIINQQRQERKIRVVSKEAQHISTAAQLGLGTADPQQMDLVEIRLG